MALNKKAKVITLLSHCGRPNGEVVAKYSLKPVIPVLKELMPGVNIQFSDTCVGPEIEKMISEAAVGTVILAENLRFHKEEEGLGGDVDKFKKDLTRLGDVFINDAFGTAHRAHASMVGIERPRYAGLLMRNELNYFNKVLSEPSRPFVAVLGGAKIKDKIQVIFSLLDKVDEVIIGGGMAYTFLKVINNIDIGRSLYDKTGAEIVPSIMSKAKEKNVKIHLPVDFFCGDDFKRDCNTKVFTLEEGIADPWEGMDIGPKTIKNFEEVIARAKLICWNGPQGVFEFEAFSKGSLAVLDAICRATKDNGCISVVGGGDSAALCQKFGRVDQMSHVSTGGGASLELLEGKQLPGVVALNNK